MYLNNSVIILVEQRAFQQRIDEIFQHIFIDEEGEFVWNDKNLELAMCMLKVGECIPKHSKLLH